MSGLEILRWDVDVVNDCLRELPSPETYPESHSDKIRDRPRPIVTPQFYTQMDQAWKGIDDNETWAS
jgi:hypothetical protein